VNRRPKPGPVSLTRGGWPGPPFLLPERGARVGDGHLPVAEIRSPSPLLARQLAPSVTDRGPALSNQAGGLARLRFRLAGARLPLRRAAPAAFSALPSSLPLAGRKSASSFSAGSGLDSATQPVPPQRALTGAPNTNRTENTDMSKIAISESHIGIAAGAISQAYVRLRGAQKANINVHHAHTDIARVTLTWGRILFTFFNALS
jgi:hypothetical protein